MRIINEYKSFLYFMVPTFNSKFDYYYFYTISGFTNPTPLTEILSSRFVRKGTQKDWFVIQLLVYNWFKNLESFLVHSG